MTYCSKCGKKNPEDAKFCNQCQTPLMGTRVDHGKRMEKECEDDCGGSSRGSSIFWGVIVILIGLFILIEFVLPEITTLPSWLSDFEWWWLIGLLIALFIISAGIRIIIKKR